MHTGIKGLLTAAAAALAVAGSAGASFAAGCGDVNNDGSVAINDVSIHLRVVGGVETNPANVCGGGANLGAAYGNCADLNGDGTGPSDISDTDLLLQRVSGIKACPSDQCKAKVTHNNATNLPSNITGNYQVSGTTTFSGLTFVEPGAVLTVAPGSVLKGLTGTASPSTIIVKPGGRINMVGTAGSPITITSNAATSVGGAGATVGDIGGIAVLGRSTVNESSPSLEGLPPDDDLVYGGGDVNDFSGCMSYTRVQFSGRELSVDNELNLVVFAGVGRTTRIDHVQGHAGLDDCIEFFGGTANSKFMVASACGDDGFDTQLGTRGGLQFGLISQQLSRVESGGSNGFENDNSEFGFNNGPPFNEPKYCNVTALGIRGQAGSPPATNQVGILLRRGTAGSWNNILVKDFAQVGYQLRDGATTRHACLNGTTLGAATNPPLTLKSILFANNGAAGTTAASNDATCDGVAPDDADCTCTTTQHFAASAANNLQQTANAAVTAVGGGAFPPVNLVPSADAIFTTNVVNCTTVDSSFVAAPYIGGFQPGGTDWTAGWTAYPNN